ncbi:hypothetical protein PF005_g14568 [Phytophthora fragariae]|uniref:RXLR phytopathogen effector protein WY-domain domain-containing protein n=1 Tax=Phytophthora fragariae TaxID=53985 RepID=A0A6A3IU33_9STRA|nr:hypothetical protein PF011_g21095 [Phytophthora fragariae]KAE9101828.1 hypothetical protein PF007_g14983 [Phytophthora fragariae]KAE9202414.1 hypothetical protein PF005_g14568 [Phytophthora fragariae]KAE9218676.1 hypothetical protein PF004_g13806 [Phytophthora fragariae]
MDAWLYNGKDADDVFGILGIRAEGSRSMNSRKLVVLDEYINLFNARYPSAATDSFIVLRDGFGGEADFTRVLSMAKLRPESERMIANTSKYQGELFSKWMVEDMLEPKGVLSTVLEGGSYGTARSEDKLVVNHYNVFYKRRTREQ